MRITLKEYAIRWNKNPTIVRQKALRKGFLTARKEGRDWFIDEDEPYVDNRISSGKYIGRKRKPKGTKRVKE